MLPRLFKAKRFAALAGKAWIGDDELRDAFTEMLNGQAESLRWSVEEAFELKSSPVDCLGQGARLLGLPVPLCQERSEQHQSGGFARISKDGKDLRGSVRDAGSVLAGYEGVCGDNL